jgi:hypothetical protein
MSPTSYQTAPPRGEADILHGRQGTYHGAALVAAGVCEPGPRAGPATASPPLAEEGVARPGPPLWGAGAADLSAPGPPSEPPRRTRVPG